MDDFELKFADQSGVIRWIAVVTFFWSAILLIELMK